MNVSEAILESIEDSGKGIQWLANELNYSQSSGVSKIISRGGATVELLCHICEILDYELVMRPKDEKRREIVIEARGERVKRKSGTHGRVPVEYDKELFERLYGQVQSGELTVKAAAEMLGVNYAKWHRLAKAKKDE